jgi:hypothetical protein
MRKFDLVIQSILMMAAIGACLSEAVLILLSLIQLLMGIWQLISATASSFRMKNYSTRIHKLILLYWAAVIMYGLVGVLTYASVASEQEPLLTWFFSAWIIAIYYFVITIMRLREKEKIRQTFLDLMN